ncbi:Vgb family protein [Burkholderia sp. MR1-5-21]
MEVLISAGTLSNGGTKMIARNLISSHSGFLQAKRRSICRRVMRSALLSAALGLGALSLTQASQAQSLFVGDGGDNSVKQLDVSNATTKPAPFVASGSAGLNGPKGMIFTDGQLVVVNQNSQTNIPGEILRFDGTTGKPLAPLVASGDPNAPFAPRGIVRGGPDRAFYVADDGTRANTCDNQGDVKKYSDKGDFLGNLDRHNFPAAFYPRGVVFGPDGLLYVSARGCPLATDANTPLIGYVLRFNPRTNAFVDVFASNSKIPDLHRPEGLVFDSVGNLWVTSFRNVSDASDTDKILKLDSHGHLLDELVLSKPHTNRAYAQAIIFGPGGNLYIPITGNEPQTTGQLRRCNPATKACDVIVPTHADGGTLIQPWYPIFRNSDPATLNYNED